MRRCGSDIGDSFGSAVGEFMTCASNGDQHAGWDGQSGFWNDADSLEVGNGKQTKAEYQAHFSMWCVGKHPLILGCDLSKPTCSDCTSAEEVLDILKNAELIKVGHTMPRILSYACIRVSIAALATGCLRP